MKKVLIASFVLIGITGTALAEEGNKFKPEKIERYQETNPNSQMGDSEVEFLKQELRMQIEEMRAFRNEFYDFQEENDESKKTEKKIEKIKEKSFFIGLVDGSYLYKKKESGDFYTLSADDHNIEKEESKLRKEKEQQEKEQQQIENLEEWGSDNV